MARSGARFQATMPWRTGTSPHRATACASPAACLAASICRSRTVRECSKCAGSAEKLSQGLDLSRRYRALVAIAEMGADEIHHIRDLLVGEMATEGRHALVA